MSLSKPEPRYRISAKQTAKNLWQLDATVEYLDVTVKVSNDPEDAGNVTDTDLGLRLLNLIVKTEQHFRADGRRMVGDDEPPAGGKKA